MFIQRWSPEVWLLERAEWPVLWLRRYVGHRNFIIMAVWLCSAISFWLSFELRYDFQVPPTHSLDRWLLTPAVALLKTLVFILLRGHSASWRYTGMRDVERLLAFNVVSTSILLGIQYLGELPRVGRGVILIDFFINSILVGGLLISLRIYRERFLSLQKADQSTPEKRAVIFGAGDGGEMIVREIHRNPTARLSVRAFFDDNPSKHGTTIHGVTVVGGLELVSGYVADNGIDMVIVAIPSANKHQMRRIHGELRALGITIKTLPPLAEFIHSTPTLAQLRDINIADLLGRKEIRIDSQQVSDLIEGKAVLVTGAGGSIGSEICFQALRRRPARLLLMERSENSLFHLHRRLLEQAESTEVVPLLCDITDHARVFQEFAVFKPNLVFHAAAHKHVPMQELNPAECFRNNVGGTSAVARASHRFGAERFILISTDKAVNPTSVMGASKRACEIYCQAFAHTSKTQFVAVRFGNVLASEGSVVPIFLEQISRGGPITITHPDMQRYFMTIPEAVSLVLQAAAIGSSGQILVLDMGKPVRIVDLAEQLLQLLGKSPAEIPIEFIGCRPGEKLFEELSCPEESCLKTDHESIWIFDRNGTKGKEDVEAIEDSVRELSENPDPVAAQRFLSRIVPEYVPVHHDPNTQPTNSDLCR